MLALKIRNLSADETIFSFSERSLNLLRGSEEGGSGVLPGGLGDSEVGFGVLDTGLEVDLGLSLSLGGLLAVVDRNRLLSLLNEEDIGVYVWVIRK